MTTKQFRVESVAENIRKKKSPGLGKDIYLFLKGSLFCFPGNTKSLIFSPYSPATWASTLLWCFERSGPSLGSCKDSRSLLLLLFFPGTGPISAEMALIDEYRRKIGIQRCGLSYILLALGEVKPLLSLLLNYLKTTNKTWAIFRTFSWLLSEAKMLHSGIFFLFMFCLGLFCSFCCWEGF